MVTAALPLAALATVTAASLQIVYAVADDAIPAGSVGAVALEVLGFGRYAERAPGWGHAWPRPARTLAVRRHHGC